MNWARIARTSVFATTWVWLGTACTERPQSPSGPTTATASVQSIGGADRTLGTRFTQPPANIGDGDGFAPQPFVNGDGHPSVMVVAHHETGLKVGALNLYTSERITPLHLGSDRTSNGFGYVQDPQTRRFYVPTTNAEGALTFSCLNGNFRPSLGETVSLCTSLTPVAGTLAQTGSNLSADGLAHHNSRIYGAAALADGSLVVVCAATDGTACTGYPKTIATDTQTSRANSVRFQTLSDTRVAVGFSRSSGQISAVCFDLLTAQSCGRVDSSATATPSQPVGLHSATGTLTGFCAFSSEQMTLSACVDLTGQTISGQQWPAQVLNSPQYGMAVRMPGTGRYMLTSLGSESIVCVDMSQGGRSCGVTPKFSGTSAAPYGSAFHENTSTGQWCLLTYNDSKQLGIFRVDAVSGALSEDLRCFAPGGVSSTWRVNDPIPSVCPRLSGSQWGTLTITLGTLTLDEMAVAEAYGGDVSILDPLTGQLLARKLFARTGTDVTLSLPQVGIDLAKHRTFDVQVRVLQPNGYQLRAGYQVSAKLAVDLTCGA